MHLSRPGFMSSVFFPKAFIRPTKRLGEAIANSRQELGPPKSARPLFALPQAH